MGLWLDLERQDLLLLALRQSRPSRLGAPQHQQLFLELLVLFLEHLFDQLLSRRRPGPLAPISLVLHRFCSQLFFLLRGWLLQPLDHRLLEVRNRIRKGAEHILQDALLALLLQARLQQPLALG